MKIKTEILQGVFIVTCQGSRLDASFAQDFFNAMKTFIQKGHVDILLDLSQVDFVDSTGLGAIVRCLKEIGGRERLVLCGVNPMVLSLLKMTRLDEVFLQAPSREEGLTLLSQQKEKEQQEKAAPQEEEEEEEWAILLEVEDGEVEEVSSGERRRYRRINHKRIIDDDIVAHCTNIATGKHSTAVILDISPGGLFMVSSSLHGVGDELIIMATVGTQFRFKERAEIRSSNEGKYGLEFMNPSEETRSFLNQLTGAVSLEKGERFRHL